VVRRGVGRQPGPVPLGQDPVLHQAVQVLVEAATAPPDDVISSIRPRSVSIDAFLSASARCSMRAATRLGLPLHRIGEHLATADGFVCGSSTPGARSTSSRPPRATNARFPSLPLVMPTYSADADVFPPVTVNPTSTVLPWDRWTVEA
jgi:hypothetical protein